VYFVRSRSGFAPPIQMMICTSRHV